MPPFEFPRVKKYTCLTSPPTRTLTPPHLHPHQSTPHPVTCQHTSTHPLTTHLTPSPPTPQPLTHPPTHIQTYYSLTQTCTNPPLPPKARLRYEISTWLARHNRLSHLPYRALGMCYILARKPKTWVLFFHTLLLLYRRPWSFAFEQLFGLVSVRSLCVFVCVYLFVCICLCVCMHESRESWRKLKCLHCLSS